jgi:tol-pal system protein YbgF
MVADCKRSVAGRWLRLSASALILTAGVAGPVAAQSTDAAALLNRIEFLERQIRLLSDRVSAVGPAEPVAPSPSADDASTAAASAATTRLSVRVDALEQDIRAVTGRLEEVSYQIRRLSDRVEKLAADVDYRLGQQPAPGGGAVVPPPPAAAPPGGPAAASPTPRAAPAGPPEPKPGLPVEVDNRAGGPKVLGPVPTPDDGTAGNAPPAPGAADTPSPGQGTPREQYAYAFNLMHKGQYPAAGAAFREFLERHPNDPLTENASYWLGETYYARGDYANAASTFLETYEKFKTGSKAPDTLLKLGMSLARLKKNQEACATFKELSRAFPAAPTAIKSKASEEQRQLGCR